MERKYKNPIACREFWIEQLNLCVNNPEMFMQNSDNEGVANYINSSKIKLIVFDLHGTLTGRTSIHPYHIDYRNRYIKKISNQPFPDQLKVGTDEAFALFPDVDKDEFYKHRDNDPSFKFEKIHSPTPRLAEELRFIANYFHIIIYTDSYLKQIERTLQVTGLENIFHSVIGIENGYRKISSQFTMYPELCKKYKIKMDNILIVGDRMDKDLNPVLKAGGNGIRIESNEYIHDAIEIIKERLLTKL